MLTIAAFNPISNTSGSFAASTLQTGSTMIVKNKSYVDIQLTFSNGDIHPVLANDRRMFKFPPNDALPGPVIQWTQVNIDYPQTVIQLENIVYVELYDPSETVDETYPAIVAREPVPNLIPYNIGQTIVGIYDTSVNGTKQQTIWPSSYAGLAIAPTSIGGLGYDHFWMYQGLNPATPFKDLPGVYSGTGKTGNDGTIANAALATNIPGPFSLPGLKPVDTTTFVTATSWALANTIPWASSTSGFTIELWVKPHVIGSGQYLFADNPLSSTAGVAIFLKSDGTVAFSVGDAAGTATASLTKLQPDVWYYIRCDYTGTVDNHILLYINGNFETTSATTSPISNSPNVPNIAARNGGAVPLTGAIGYVGILLSGVSSGVGSAVSRYQHGLQSLNQDYQNVWLTGLDLTVNSVSALAAMTEITLNNIYNFAGLLNVATPAAQSMFHFYNNRLATQNYWFSQLAALQAITYPPILFEQPLTHVNDKFLNFTVAVSTGIAFPNIAYNVRGYNILGIA